MKTVKISREALKNRNFKAKKVEVVESEDSIDAKIIAELLKKI